MEQIYNNGQNEFLWKLLANPADDAHLYNYNVQRLVNDFPQSGLLQALLAHTSEEKNLKQASVYFNPRSLFKLVNTPESFPVVRPEQIINKFNAPAPAHEDIAQHSETTPQIVEDEIEHDEPVAFAEPAVPETIAETAAETYVEPAKTEDITNHTAAPVDEDQSFVAEPGIIHEDVQEAPAVYHHHEAAENIEDEVFEEIAPIENVGVLHDITQEVPEAAAKPVEHAPVVENEAKTPVVEKPKLDDEADRLIVGNIAATDFFMFERAFGDQKPAMAVEDEQPEAMPEAPPAQAPIEVKEEKPTPTPPAADMDTENQNVSMYNDDKMPYSFMWWLDKTRKEHSGVYQPFVGPAPDTTAKKAKGATDELQQQYYENIFHITSIEDLEKNAPPARHEFGRKKKEHVIIERFIQEEPQIRPQSSDKLDNENKAKKSSEDRDELVTETLANIYVEQMLYHKAISSYKKLILKFPEKSRYFADKIEQLEKRTN